MSKKECQHMMGRGGTCICPKCNTTVLHRHGVPCQEERCPECNAKMLREGSEHHELWLKQKIPNTRDELGELLGECVSDYR